MNDLITFITNNGIAVVLMVYFLRNNHKSTSDLILDNKELIKELVELRKDTNTVLKVLENCKKNVG